MLRAKRRARVGHGRVRQDYTEENDAGCQERERLEKPQPIKVYEKQKH